MEETGGGIRDHPREYGENNLVTDPPYGIQGPSPRIRGEWANCDDQLGRMGTIPANTGRIRRQDTTGVIDPDHPREYGENGHIISAAASVGGPSPRIRGECHQGHSR